MGAAIEQISGQRGIKVDRDQFVAGRLQVTGHKTAHNAQANKAYNGFIAQSLFSYRSLSSAMVSQPAMRTLSSISPIAILAKVSASVPSSR